MKFFVTCDCAYACTSALTGSAQNVATRKCDSVCFLTASSRAALAGSVMSCRTTALPDLNTVIFSFSMVSNARKGLGNTGEPSINTERVAARSGPISM